MSNDIKGLSKTESAYINLFGVCPEIEKNIPLHSYKDMILFAEKAIAEENERYEKEKLKCEMCGNIGVKSSFYCPNCSWNHNPIP